MNKINKPQQKNWNEYSNFPNFLAEPKLDGMRIQLSYTDKFRLLRENGLDKTHQFPEIEKEFKIMYEDDDGFGQDTILDGELCILNDDGFGDDDDFTADFFKLQTRNVQDKLKIKLLSKKIPATFVAFDVLRHNGKNFEHKNLEERKGILDDIIGYGVGLERIKQIQSFDNPNELLQLHEQRLSDKEENILEGIILKEKSGSYNFSKWYKFKHYEESDFKVTGFTSEKKMISALELANVKGESVGKVNYTGYPQTKEWQKKVVGMTAVVLHMNTNLGKVRFPILKELRK